jgi:hypothetical protein
MAMNIHRAMSEGLTMTFIALLLALHVRSMLTLEGKIRQDSFKHPQVKGRGREYNRLSV